MKNALTVHWLMGMIDGDGYFGLEQVQKTKSTSPFYRPIFALSQKDPAILYKIKKFIGCGTVSAKGKKKDQYHFRIRTKRLFLSHLIPLFKDKTFQTYKQEQFELLKKVLISELKTPITNDTWYDIDQTLRQRHFDYVHPSQLTWDWFAGFFEAEGCFSINIQSYKDIRFLLKVTQNNKLLLFKIQQWFDCGTIQTERPGIYNFQITSVKSIQKNMAYLEKPFHGQKNIARVKWLKAYRMVIASKQAGLDSKRYQQLLRIKESLNKSF